MQLSEVTICELPALAGDANIVQQSHLSRPTLKRSQNYNSSHSISARYKRPRVDSFRSSSASPPRVSQSVEDAASLQEPPPRPATPLDSSQIQPGTSRKTSRAGQFLQRAWPLRRRNTGLKSNQTTTVNHEHPRERQITFNLCPPSLKVTCHKSEQQSHESPTHVGMSQVTNRYPYFMGQPIAGPSNFYALLNSRGRAKAPQIPTGEDVHGNPLTPTAATNRDASVESSRWCGLRPGTPGPSNTFAYFPAHPSNDNPLRTLTSIKPGVRESSMNTNSQRDAGKVADSTYGSERSSDRFSYDEASLQQLSDLRLSLSMKHGGSNGSPSRSNISTTTTFLTAPEHEVSEEPLSAESDKTSSLHTPSKEPLPMEIDPHSAQDTVDNHTDASTSTNANISLFGDIPRSQPIDIPTVPERDSRRASLRQIQSSEHLRDISISRQIFGRMHEGSRGSSLERGVEDAEPTDGFAGPMDLEG
ncbi:hypothetical protein NX059_003769 [Plenodomus lindquistii]|nr:hypothetical protein NX059_003769 [Plenodomus lindquistii]